MFQIWYVALPSGPLSSLFKWWLGQNWPCEEGVLGSNTNIL